MSIASELNTMATNLNTVLSDCNSALSEKGISETASQLRYVPDLINSIVVSTVDRTYTPSDFVTAYLRTPINSTISITANTFNAEELVTLWEEYTGNSSDDAEGEFIVVSASFSNGEYLQQGYYTYCSVSGYCVDIANRTLTQFSIGSGGSSVYMNTAYNNSKIWYGTNSLYYRFNDGSSAGAIYANNSLNHTYYYAPVTYTVSGTGEYMSDSSNGSTSTALNTPDKITTTSATDVSNNLVVIATNCKLILDDCNTALSNKGIKTSASKLSEVPDLIKSIST